MKEDGYCSSWIVVVAGAFIIRGPVRSFEAFDLRCRDLVTLFVVVAAGFDLEFFNVPNLIFGIFCCFCGVWTILKLFRSSPESSLAPVKMFPSSVFGRIGNVILSGSTRDGVLVIWDVLIMTGGKMSSSLRSKEFTRELERLAGFLAELRRLFVGRCGLGVAGKSSLSHVSGGGWYGSLAAFFSTSVSTSSYP